MAGVGPAISEVILCVAFNRRQRQCKESIYKDQMMRQESMEGMNEVRPREMEGREKGERGEEVIREPRSPPRPDLATAHGVVDLTGEEEA